jgi:hypothetical protein
MLVLPDYVSFRNVEFLLPVGGTPVIWQRRRGKGSYDNPGLERKNPAVVETRQKTPPRAK